MKQHALPKPITFLSSDYYSAGRELEQIQFLLGHRSVETTERYLGSRQRLVQAVNDHLGIEPRVWLRREPDYREGDSSDTTGLVPDCPSTGIARQEWAGEARLDQNTLHLAHEPQSRQPSSRTVQYRLLDL